MSQVTFHGKGNNQVVSYFWIRLTFPRISQIAFDIKAKGTSVETFFTVVERERVKKKDNNKREETVKLFNVQI